MPFSIERNDLSQVRADAIVVAANENLKITGGVGATVAEAAGFRQLQAACDDIGFCPTGSAVVTPGFNLHARFIVHVVGPVWAGGSFGEADLLRRAYDNALTRAVEAGAQSIALPLISAGTYGFPPELSLSIASEAIREFLDAHDVEVRLVLYSRASLVAGLAAYGAVAAYIDDRYVQEHRASGSMVAVDEDRPYAESPWLDAGEPRSVSEGMHDASARSTEVPESAYTMPPAPPVDGASSASADRWASLPAGGQPSAPAGRHASASVGGRPSAPAAKQAPTPAEKRPSKRVAEWWSALTGGRKSERASAPVQDRADEAATFPMGDSAIASEEETDSSLPAEEADYSAPAEEAAPSPMGDSAFAPEEETDSSFPAEEAASSYPMQGFDSSLPAEDVDFSLLTEEADASLPTEEAAPSYSVQGFDFSLPEEEADYSAPAEEAAPSFPAEEAVSSYPMQGFDFMLPTEEAASSHPVQGFDSSLPAEEVDSSLPWMGVEYSSAREQVALSLQPEQSAPCFTGRIELSELLDSLDEPFSTTLLSLIDARGMNDVDVYKRANMSRQLFSKIRADASYRPTKKTVLALAVALRLNLAETEDLLRRAGFALSRSSKADVIVEYFIVTENYDIFEINETLYAFDQPLL